MRPCRVLVDSFADAGLSNAQMTNAREIVRRLDPDRFHVTMFYVSAADERIAQRPNTGLIRLGKTRQTVGILKEFIAGQQDIIFYLKASPASKWYLRLREVHYDDKVAIGTIESRSDLRNEPTITPEAVRLWEQTVLRCDCLFSNSHAVQKSLESEYGLPSSVIPTGVDTAFFSPAADRAPNPRLRVLFVGSLRPFKQPQLLLDAAIRFRHADFILVGDGIMAGELRDRVQKENLENVQLLGSLTPQAVREQYRQSDVFLFPSTWEGSPKVILEAAACGLPVIASSHYRPETVVDGKTGFVVSPGEELFFRLNQLLADKELRRLFGGSGRKLSERFDWDFITRQWEEVFVSLTTAKANGHVA